MRLYLAIAIFLLSAADAWVRELAIPPGGKMFVGWLIAPEQHPSPSVDEIRYPDRKLWVLRSAEGVVVAIMRVPSLRKGFEYNYGDCKLSGLNRMDVIASVRHQRYAEWSSAVDRAWVIDPTNAEFRAISPKGIICRNESYGV
jgi:hypothetical protein